jgi:hypothetical protein
MKRALAVKADGRAAQMGVISQLGITAVSISIARFITAGSGMSVD